MKCVAKRKSATMLLVFLTLFMVSLELPATANAGQDATVQVTLRNGEVMTMAPNSFQIDWKFPVTVLEEETCVRKVIRKEQIKDIHFINKAWNSCEGKEAWLFEIDFTDGNYVQGFLKSLPEAKSGPNAASEKNMKFKIRGISAQTGAEETLSYDKIRKISFVKSKQ